jgi:transposase-like protein
MPGKKGDRHADPAEPPRRRANKRQGHGTSANDRPPVVGTVGRRTGRCRLRVREHTEGKTLRGHVPAFTRSAARCHTEEWRGYQGLRRCHATVWHSQKEWARDDDGDGIREVHANTLEGLGTAVRNFLRPFRGVHKKHRKYYLAICEHRINRKRISPAFIAGLVVAH